MHGEVPAAQMIRRDLRDERLVRRPVKALADAEDPKRDHDHNERCAPRQPVAARVDHQPRHEPEDRHQRERAQPATTLDRTADRKLHDHDQPGVDEEDRADLAQSSSALEKNAMLEGTAGEA